MVIVGNGHFSRQAGIYTCACRSVHAAVSLLAAACCSAVAFTSTPAALHSQSYCLILQGAATCFSRCYSLMLVALLQECVQQCREQDACASATFNYATHSCHLWRPGSSSSSSSDASATLAVAGGIAFKTWMSTYGPDDKRSGSDDNGSNQGGGDYYNYDPDYSNPPPPPPDWYGIPGQAGKAVQPQSLGSGYFTFWPNATAALASILPGALVPAGTDSLTGCLAACTMDNLCTGAVFGAYDAASGAISEVVPGVKCMRLKGTVVEGDPRRTLVKAKDTALR
jgi:hypothetical protein